jgi:pterin-4a-carbinolamine dehydratase
VSYGSCGVSYTTHSIGGLSDNDFICAAKIDRIAAASISAIPIMNRPQDDQS